MLRRVHTQTTPAVRRYVHSSCRLLDPLSLLLLSYLHSTAPPSPERYDKRYEVRFQPERTGLPKLTYGKSKRCMLAFLKLVTDFARGRALSAMQATISATHPHPAIR